MKNKDIIFRIKQCVLRAYPKGLKTGWWLIKITVPVSFLIMVLNHLGILNQIALLISPFFSIFNIPGIAAVILITGIFTNVYSVLAILALLNLPIRDGTIIAAMCLVSHNFVIENIVMKKTGSSFWWITLVRLCGSIAIAYILNQILPLSHSGALPVSSLPLSDLAFSQAFYNWLVSTSDIIIKILIIVVCILIIHEILEEFGIINYIVRLFSPLIKWFGLPESTTFSWVVANTVGLAYGSAIILEESNNGTISREEADLLNHHIAVSHSEIEDPLLFLALGYPIIYLILPRVFLAFAAVWIKRGINKVNRKKSIALTR